MNRRAFLGSLTGGLLAAPLAAKAQQAPAKIPLIGLLDLGAPDPARLKWWDAFRSALHELGYVEGRSIRFEARWALGNLDRLPSLLAELIQRQVDILVTAGGETARVAKQATTTLPIVMATGSDPVKLGVVKSFARPGGNVTGVVSLSSQLIAKRVELLKELLPKISGVAILSDETPTSRLSVQESEAAARTLGLRVRSISAHNPDAFGRAFSAAAKEGALIVVGGPFIFSERKRIADLALMHHLPTVVGGQDYAEAGGLLSYAVNFSDLFHRAAWYVDKILRGARPGDLPVEQPKAFELVINLKTAKALGLTIPPSLLQRADQVIE